MHARSAFGFPVLSFAHGLYEMDAVLWGVHAPGVDGRLQFCVNGNNRYGRTLLIVPIILMVLLIVSTILTVLLILIVLPIVLLLIIVR